MEASRAIAISDEGMKIPAANVQTLLSCVSAKIISDRNMPRRTKDFFVRR